MRRPFRRRARSRIAIDTLGEMMTDDAGRLLVLGGHGRSGSRDDRPGRAAYRDYANNDGWYDDTSDGPVMARLVMYSEQVQQNRFVDVEYPAWVDRRLSALRAADARHGDHGRGGATTLRSASFAGDTALYGRLDSFDNPDRVDPSDETALRLWKAGRLTWNTIGQALVLPRHLADPLSARPVSLPDRHPRPVELSARPAAARHLRSLQAGGDAAAPRDARRTRRGPGRAAGRPRRRAKARPWSRRRPGGPRTSGRTRTRRGGGSKTLIGRCAISCSTSCACRARRTSSGWSIGSAAASTTCR